MNIAATRRASSLDHAIAPILPVLLVVVAVACIAGFARAIAIAPLHVPLDPDEGWNAYHAAAAMAGHGLYPAASGLMVNNYPPLSFYLVGFLGELIGDGIVAGRIVSLLSFLCISGFVALAVRRMGDAWQAAAFAALFFAAVLLLTSDYVGMDDPQLLGHGLQLAALFLVLRETRMPRAMLGAAALFVAGGFVKHNLFALPLASLIWLLLFDRPNALRLATGIAVLSLLGLLTFRVFFGFDLLDRLASARSWSFAQAMDNFLVWLPVEAIPLGALAGLAILRRNDRAVVIVAIYAAVALITGIFLLGGAGVDVNALFDADIALALGAGLALGRLLQQRNPWLHISGRAFALACLLPLVVLVFEDRDWRDPAFWTHPMRNEAALAAQDIAFLHAHSGPAICENLAFCYWAAKRDPVDVFNFDQQLVARARDPAPFLRLIDSHHFTVMELDEITPFPLPPLVHTAMIRNYRVDHTDDEGVFYLPR
ncbi:MAG: glycosyltransferase family 39 protein [Rhizomicrobium sp.]